MIEALAALVVDEAKWLTASMLVAGIAVAVRILSRPAAAPRRLVTHAALALFFAATVGGMALGHLAAVTVRLAQGTLEGSLPALYAIGLALALPSWWLTGRAWQAPAAAAPARSLDALTAWTVVTLLVLGVQNLPLAAPGLFALAYTRHRRPRVGIAIVGVAVVASLALFVGSLVFLASGQTFEQFSARP
jgi:hypothetical protein